VPEQWRRFRELGLHDARGNRAFGAICGTSADRFEYLAGVEVESFDGLPDQLGRMRVPAQKYAVFTHDGHVSQLGATWRHIWQEWLPASGYQDAETPPFELYGERFDPDTGEGGFEIWFPIR
jgi:AraC family transcriptional regulator